FEDLPVTSVVLYDAALDRAGKNPWLTSSKDASTGLFTGGDIASLEPGKAYFVTATASATAEILIEDAGVALPPTLAVYRGFNAIGFWSISGDATADLDAYLGSVKWTVAYSFDPTPGVGWQVHRPDANLTDTRAASGRGYFVYVTQDGTLTP
ncbi:MAG: hypothetical protein HYX93_06685, partial [Chloroflexi bacterium]|nr:hypothetical protein [Chloroflexota bacterium]